MLVVYDRGKPCFFTISKAFLSNVDRLLEYSAAISKREKNENRRKTDESSHTSIQCMFNIWIIDQIGHSSDDVR